jgi:4-hydroxyproline epimerase
MLQKVAYIDSHTGGEPTRLVLAGGPDLGEGSLQARAELFRSRHDDFRAGVVREPRGSEVFVGGLLCEPTDPSHAAGVIFFNNVGTLGMCGHGMIGLVASLAHLGRIEAGTHAIETPVGTVTATLHADGRISVVNVPSWVHRTDVEVRVDHDSVITGDVAWGGNWFFLARAPRDLALEPGNLDRLLDFTCRIRSALEREGITGEAGALIDHVELFGDSDRASARNFVLCPGLEWDRSPCGTGTSAKLACLAARNELAAGVTWTQESIIGSLFEGAYEPEAEGRVLPTITGTAHVMATGELLFDEADPFRHGIPG